VNVNKSLNSICLSYKESLDSIHMDSFYDLFMNFLKRQSGSCQW